jgi:hypothetical protein
MKVSALQWKSIYAGDQEKSMNIKNDAYNLCIQTIKLCINVYGQESIATARIYRMLGSLLYYLER